jgi:hypothetical protein
VVTRLLDQITAGDGIDADLFAADTALDATVPNWRRAEMEDANMAANR